MSYGTLPSCKFTAVTPSDTAKITPYSGNNDLDCNRCRALYIGGAGNIVVKDEAGNSVTFTGVLAGTILPISTDRVMSTSTTASNIVALF